MKIVTRQEFIQWVLEQPDDRPVNMSENYASDSCGCAMIQYARDKQLFDEKLFLGCGLSTWEGKTKSTDNPEYHALAKFENDLYIGEVIKNALSLCGDNGNTTFKELKLHIKHY